MHNHFSALVFSLFKPPVYDFCPALVFMGQSRYTIKISTVPISSERKIFYGYQISGSDAGGFQFDRTPRPSPNASASPQVDRQQGGRIAVNTLVTLLVGAVFFYVQMPAINLHAEEFYGFVLLLCVTYCICALFTSGFQGTGAKGYFTFVKKQCTVPLSSWR